MSRTKHSSDRRKFLAAIGTAMSSAALARAGFSFKSSMEIEPADVAKFAVGYNPLPDFVAYQPKFREMKRNLVERFDRLQDDMISQQQRGRKTFCSRQIAREVKWLIYNTCDFSRAERRLNDLKTMLAAKADPHGAVQSAEDGSYGPCTEEWFLKLDATVDELVSLSYRMKKPKHPLKFLDRINGPEKLRTAFDAALISDIRKTGIHTRFELYALTAGLTRIILRKGGMMGLPVNYQLHADLKDTLFRFMDEKWQDPRTGYWGTWYRQADGSIVKTSDLSHTFHIISYREGKVNRWPEILATTLAIRDREYPYGWIEEKSMSNHHNYDVAAIFRLGWDHASEKQQRMIQTQVRRMLDWCLKETIDTEGAFKVLPNDKESLGATFYFGVAFLNEIGYFSTENRFWTTDKFPKAEPLRKKILAKMKALKLDDAEAMWARWILEWS